MGIITHTPHLGGTFCKRVIEDYNADLTVDEKRELLAAQRGESRERVADVMDRIDARRSRNNHNLA